MSFCRPSDLVLYCLLLLSTNNINNYGFFSIIIVLFHIVIMQKMQKNSIAIFSKKAAVPSIAHHSGGNIEILPNTTLYIEVVKERILWK